MLKPKSNREELQRIRSTLMNAAQIRETFENQTCCSKNCMQQVINDDHGRRSVQRSTSSSRIGAPDSYVFCQQVGVPPDTIPVHAFDQFLEEVRKPFRQLVAGAENQKVANEQLHYYLVQKFTENRVCDVSDDTNHNSMYTYQVYSLSRGITTVCKTAYIILTGISVDAIDYAQKRVRNNVSAESIILRNSDEKRSKTKDDQLKEAFEKFNLDYNLYSQNINRFVDILKVPDSQTAFICVTFLAEWFELAGEHEVIVFIIIISIIMFYYFVFYSQMLRRSTLIL
jgi:hypothetical protein